MPHSTPRLSPPLYARLKWLRVCVCTHTHSMRDLGCLIKSRLWLSNTHSSGADGRGRENPCVAAASEEEGREGGVYSDSCFLWKSVTGRVGEDGWVGTVFSVMLWSSEDLCGLLMFFFSVTPFLFYQWHFDLKERNSHRSHQNIRELGNYLTVISQQKETSVAFQQVLFKETSLVCFLLKQHFCLCEKSYVHIQTHIRTQFSVSLTIKINTKYIYTTVQKFEVGKCL